MRMQPYGMRLLYTTIHMLQYDTIHLLLLHNTK